MSLFNKKTKKKSSAKSGSGGLASIKSFDWKRNTPIIAIVALAGGYLLWHSFAGTQFYANQYSITNCGASLTKPSHIQVYPSPSSTKATTDFKSCQDSSSEGIIYRLYNGIGGISPRTGSYPGWIQKLAGDRQQPSVLTNDLIGASLRLSVSDAGKFTTRSSHGRTTAIINNAYATLLKRAPSKGDMSYWTGMLANKRISQASFASYLAGSQEGKTIFVTNLYKVVFHKTPTAAQLKTWTALPAASDASRLATAAKFINGVDSLNAFVNNYYEAFLGHKPDIATLKLHTNNIHSGKETWASLVLSLAGQKGSMSFYHNNFVAFAAKNKSPKVVQTALNAQNKRQTEARNNAKNTVWHYTDFVAKDVSQAAVNSNAAAKIAAISQNSITAANVASAKAQLDGINALAHSISSTQSAPMNNDLAKIQTIYKAATVVSSYSPDLSSPTNSIAVSIKTTKLYITKKDNAYQQIISYANSANNALANATNKYNTHQAQLATAAAARAANARQLAAINALKAACEQQHNIPNNSPPNYCSKKVVDSPTCNTACKAAAINKQLGGSGFIGSGPVSVPKLPIPFCAGIDNSIEDCAKEVQYNSSGYIVQYKDCNMTYFFNYHDFGSCSTQTGYWTKP